MHFQINEAFASQFAYCVDELSVPIEKINPKCVFTTSLTLVILTILLSGGSIAISHPIGLSKVFFSSLQKRGC